MIASSLRRGYLEATEVLALVTGILGESSTLNYKKVIFSHYSYFIQDCFLISNFQLYKSTLGKKIKTINNFLSLNFSHEKNKNKIIKI